MQNRIHKFPAVFRISKERNIVCFFITIFPLHFILFTKALLNTKILLKVNQLRNILKEKGKTQSPINDETAKDILKITHKLDLYSKQCYHLNKMESNLQIIETVAEREPQSVVTVSLFILMQRFNRIKILFDSNLFIEIPIQVALIVTWIISVISIVRSIVSAFMGD